MLIVTSSGDVLLCCDDAERTQRMGNVMDYTLGEIWQSPEFQRKRSLLAQGRRGEASEICAKCSNVEYAAPGENVSEFMVKKVAS
jgi:radical SAM protein with 4Fe4S-binding SPASM domain